MNDGNQILGFLVSRLCELYLSFTSKVGFLSNSNRGIYVSIYLPDGVMVAVKRHLVAKRNDSLASSSLPRQKHICNQIWYACHKQEYGSQQ